MTNPLTPGCEAGSYTLPKELIDADAASDAIQGALDEQLTGGQVVEDELQRFREGVVVAARSGKALPSGAKLIEQRIAGEVQDEVLDVLREEARQAERRARTIFGERQLEILTEHLRPALEETIAQAKKATGGDKLSALASRYGAIRGARSALDRLVPALDTFGVFGEFQDLDEWFPQFYSERMSEHVWQMINHSTKEHQEHREPQYTLPPWPSDPLDRFKWIVEHTRPWMPSAADQDARFELFIDKANAERSAAIRRGYDARAVT